MKYYKLQIPTGETFSERIGEPREFDAALGRVVESFSYLEQSLKNVITILLDLDNDISDIITSEMSFNQLVNLLSASFIHKNRGGDFHVPDEDLEGQVRELVQLCRTAQEERNKLMHSTYVAGVYRVKRTAKAKRGLRRDAEKLTADQILDIADFIGTVGVYVEELPLGLNIATSISKSALPTQYYHGDRVTYAFSYDEVEET